MSDHAHDVFRVVSVNIGALVLSVSNIEVFFRIAGLVAAFLYTCLKIYDWISARFNKTQQ